MTFEEYRQQIEGVADTLGKTSPTEEQLNYCYNNKVPIKQVIKVFNPKWQKEYAGYFVKVRFLDTSEISSGFAYLHNGRKDFLILVTSDSYHEIASPWQIITKGKKLQDVLREGFATKKKKYAVTLQRNVVQEGVFVVEVPEDLEGPAASLIACLAYNHGHITFDNWTNVQESSADLKTCRETDAEPTIGWEEVGREIYESDS